jgi:hypothetical protein
MTTPKPRKDAGTILVLLNRLNNERMPRALRLKEQVDRGECLGDHDMRFLKTVFAEAGTARRLAEKYPEYREIVERVSNLYTHITRKAAENQQAGGSKA